MAIQIKGMRTKYFLVSTAAVEVGAGLMLAILPKVAIVGLLGVTPITSSTLTISRIAGAALFSLGTASWLSRDDDGSHAATGLIAALLLYNSIAMVLLIFTGIVSEEVGLLLWPGSFLHAVLLGWSIMCLLRIRQRDPSKNCD